MGRISDRLRDRRDGWVLRYRRAVDDLAGAMSMPTGGEDCCGPDRCRSVVPGCESLYRSYVAVQGVASLFAACVAAEPELKAYSEAVEQAEERYSPDGPPTSPLTASYFNAWSFFDLSFGPDGETIGTCLIDLADALERDPEFVEAVERFAQSRMGVYEHCGANGGRIVLRELITGREADCTCPSGYSGKPGELWYVRLAEPPRQLPGDHLVVTTPYVLTGMGKDDWIAYLHRAMLHLNPARSKAQRLRHLLKFGLTACHWHDFIAHAFDYCRDGAIFLQGLPDVQGSMPRGAGNRGICRS